MPHSLPPKRKSPDDDQQDVLVVPDVELADPPAPSNAPRQPCLAPDPSHIWCQPPSPSQSSFQWPVKRRRRLSPPPASGHRRQRRSLHSHKLPQPCRPPPVARLGNDLEDIGVVATGDPGPSSGSLLHLRSTDHRLASAEQPSEPFHLIPIDPNSAHIPAMLPLINRHTLRELDLDAILRNPQLRHDILFDSGLQFRATNTRRKREVAEKYWAAVTLELQTGCTCVSFDHAGKPHPTLCSCPHIAIPSVRPILAYAPSARVVTLRMPSRIRPLLDEFLHVLLLVIQPLAGLTTSLYVNPVLLRSQMQEHSAQATYIRQIFDPALIEQELKHRVFDPSGLFRAIGATLKGHCAPMRDQSVELMIKAAEACQPDGPGTIADAVKAMRMCMDILELMKLDIANHQLQTLRPFLVRTSGQFELRTFRANYTSVTHSPGENGSPQDLSSIRITRTWLQQAHTSLLQRINGIPHPLYDKPLQYPSLCRNRQIYLATLSGITDLVFQTSCTPGGLPETLYLDSARLQLYSADAADLIAMYMFLLLYRQLVFSYPHSSTPPTGVPRVSESDLVHLKNEIRDIGSSRIGSCMGCPCPSEQEPMPDRNRRGNRSPPNWKSVRRDVVLQIAVRAKQCRDRGFQSPWSTDGTGLETIDDNTSAKLPPCPDPQLVSLALRWTDENLQPTSPLSLTLRERLRNTIFEKVVGLGYPSPGGTATSFPFLSATSSTNESAPLSGSSLIPGATTFRNSTLVSTGMEPLSEEINLLSDKITRQALIHLNAYLPLYEQPDFWDMDPSTPAPRTVTFRHSSSVS